MMVHMKTLNSYKINDILSQYCDLYEKTDYDTELRDKFRCLLATHAGTMRNNSRCKYIEALKYVEDIDLRNEALGMSMMEELAALGYLDSISYIAGKYEKTDVNKAIKLYSTCLENPNCDKGFFNFKLGLLYSNSGEKYYDIAFRYFKVAADQYERADAQYHMAIAYYYGYGVEKDIDVAFGYCKKSADSGNSDAQFWLGEDYLLAERFPLSTDYDLGYKYLKAAADQYNVNAMYFIGMMYYFGEGKEKDIAVAENWFNDAIMFGQVPGAYAYLGEIQYSQGKFNEAFKNLKRAYEEFDLDLGNETLVKMYRYGQGCKMDYSKTVELYDRINQNSKLAKEDAIFVADCYYNGTGVARNLNKAVEYYKQYADEDVQIMYKLGQIALNGNVSSLSITDAISYLTNAANRGMVDGYKLLGDYYFSKGDIFHDRALDFYKKSFSVGCADAAFYVGVIYERGSASNIYASTSEAVKWYQLAADNGSEKGKHELSCFKKTLLGFKRISK